MPLRLSPPAVPGTTVCGLEHAFTMAVAGQVRCNRSAVRHGANCRAIRPGSSVCRQGDRCPPSALYTFLRWQAWLGVGRARGRGRSPNLTGFTPGVSARRLKLFQVPCVYRFHHSGFSGNPPCFRQIICSHIDSSKARQTVRQGLFQGPEFAPVSRANSRPAHASAAEWFP